MACSCGGNCSSCNKQYGGRAGRKMSRKRPIRRQNGGDLRPRGRIQRGSGIPDPNSPINTATNQRYSVDDVPALLGKDEYVINSQAAKAVGYNFLDKINNIGTDKPNQFKRGQLTRHGSNYQKGGRVNRQRGGRLRKKLQQGSRSNNRSNMVNSKRVSSSRRRNTNLLARDMTNKQMSRLTRPRPTVNTRTFKARNRNNVTTMGSNNLRAPQNNRLTTSQGEHAHPAQTTNTNWLNSETADDSYYSGPEGIYSHTHDVETTPAGEHGPHGEGSAFSQYDVNQDELVNVLDVVTLVNEVLSEDMQSGGRVIKKDPYSVGLPKPWKEQ